MDKAAECAKYFDKRVGKKVKVGSVSAYQKSNNSRAHMLGSNG